MATYYVRKTGSDAYTTVQAQVVSTPWLTIDKAANEVAAGDTVYVGAGVYREQVTMDTSGTNGSEISFIADVDGVQTGDAGLVIISAYADEQSVASRASCVDANEKEFIEWVGFVMTGGTSGVVYDLHANDVNYEGCLWEDCVFISGHAVDDKGFYLDFNAATTPTNQGPTWQRCVFDGNGLQLVWDANETAERDLKVTVESCAFIGAPGAFSYNAGVLWDVTVTGTYGSGGVTVNNCLFTGRQYSVYVEHGTSTTYPVAVTNSVIRHCRSGPRKDTTNDSALTSAYNTIVSCQTPYTNVTSGTGDRDTTTDPGLMGGVDDYPLWRFWGWSPFRPFEPIRTPDDSYTHSVIGDGDTATAAAFDLYNEDRPMYGTVDDRGAVEGRARPEVETTTVDAGDTSARFEGAGFHDFLIPVAAASTTVTVEAQFDASYTGTLPQLLLMNAPGLGEGTPDTVTTGSGTWDTLSINFTPTGDGIARVRIKSNDTSAAGECFFDTLAVT